MPMRIGDAMPPLDGATTWFNGSQEDIQEHIKGKPTLVHFWAVSCVICKDKMPQLQELIRKYEPLGLHTIAVHMPRYEADTDLDTVNQAMQDNNISEVTAVDSLHKLKDAFLNEQGWVPVYYLFDAEGKLVVADIGHYESEQFTIDLIHDLLAEKFPTFAVLKSKVNTNPVRYLNS